MSEAIGFMGPYGAGKTESLAQTGAYLQEEGMVVRAIINDLGSASADRGRMAARGIDLTGLNGGCVGCGDTGSFRRELDRAEKDGVDALLFEAPATLHAGEVRDEVNVFFPDTSVVAVWDALGHNRNYQFGPALKPVGAADVVGLTKHDSLSPGSLAKVRHDLSRVAVRGVEIFELPRDGYGGLIVDRLRLAREKGVGAVQCLAHVACSHHDHGHHGHHGHDHHDHDHHDHHRLPELNPGREIVWLESIDTVHGVEMLPVEFENPDHLRDALTSAGAIRAKGVVFIDGSPVHVQHTPEQTEAGEYTEGDRLYVYGENADGLAGLAEFAEKRLLLGDGDLSYKELVAQYGDVAGLSEMITEKLAMYPPSVVDDQGDVLVDFGEADIAYQIAKQRPDIDDELRKQAFSEYIRVRLEAANELKGRRDVARERLRLGVVLAFHEKEATAHMIADQQRKEIRGVRPWDMLVNGLAKLSDDDMEQLNFDPKQRVAEENPGLIKELLEYGVGKGYCEESAASQAFDDFAKRYIAVCKDDKLESWWRQEMLRGFQKDARVNQALVKGLSV